MKKKLLKPCPEKSQIKTNCIICNSIHMHNEFEQPGLRESFKAIMCPLSGLRSIYPSPINFSDGKSYKNSTGVSSLNKSWVKQLLRRGWINLRIKPVALNLIKELSGGRVLDIGAGDGSLIQLIKHNDKKNNYKLSAIEVSDPDYLHLKNKGINVKQVTLEDANFPENSFDAVLATHMFEHVPNLIGLMSEIKKILIPGGLLIASVPSESALSMRLGLKKGWKDLGIRGHLYSFNKTNFPKLFLNCGFNVLVSEESLIVPQIIVVGVNVKNEKPY